MLQGGGLIAVPGDCKLSLIRKLRSDESLSAARQELESVVRKSVPDRQIGIAFSYPAGRDHAIGGEAFQTDPDEPGVLLLVELVRRRRVDRGRIAGAPFWSEASF